MQVRAPMPGRFGARISLDSRVGFQVFMPNHNNSNDPGTFNSQRSPQPIRLVL